MLPARYNVCAALRPDTMDWGSAVGAGRRSQQPVLTSASDDNYSRGHDEGDSDGWREGVMIVINKQ